MVNIIRRSRITPERDLPSVEEARLFLLFMLEKILDYHDDIRVSSEVGPHTAKYQVDCNPADLGKLIGSKGKTISGMRTLLSAYLAKKGLRAIIEIPYIPLKKEKA